jgi:shikimate 5-dehydrogenase
MRQIGVGEERVDPEEHHDRLAAGVVVGEGGAAGAAVAHVVHEGVEAVPFW